MNAIKKIIEDGLKENEKELKNKLMELDDIKEIISQNKNFSFVGYYNISLYFFLE